MDRSAEMTAFVRAVDTGGFSAAARELNLTPSALSKLVTRLEDRLGARLLQRTTRRLHLTPEGEAFYQRARRILVDMAEAEAEVLQSAKRPQGLLRMHCGSAFGMHQLAPAIPDFLERYPGVHLDITINDQAPAAVEEGIDLAIRIGQLDESSMVARRICNLERVICAAPAYLAKYGTLDSPSNRGVFSSKQCKEGFMAYDLVDLKLLVSIVEHGTLSKAAAQNSLASSSASVRLNKLEFELGAALFIRHRRGLTLTSAGSVVFSHAMKVLNKVTEFEEELLSISENNCL